MVRTLKTACEIAEIIKARLNIAGLDVTVETHPTHGWHATVVAKGNVWKYRNAVERVCREMRARYELAT